MQTERQVGSISHLFKLLKQSHLESFTQVIGPSPFRTSLSLNSTTGTLMSPEISSPGAFCCEELALHELCTVNLPFSCTAAEVINSIKSTVEWLVRGSQASRDLPYTKEALFNFKWSSLGFQEVLRNWNHWWSFVIGNHLRKKGPFVIPYISCSPRVCLWPSSRCLPPCCLPLPWATSRGFWISWTARGS